MTSWRFSVMAGLVPAIHAFLARPGGQGVDGRNKCGHDDPGTIGRWSAP
jgi:hypothetical protein